MNEKISHRILIIEDNSDSAELLKVLLEINNHKVEIAFDGESGLTKASWFKPQIIVCDIGLPGKVNGLEVAKTLRQNENTCAVHLIALSGYGQVEDVKESETAGFNHHFVKPPDFDKLINLIENLEVIYK